MLNNQLITLATDEQKSGDNLKNPISLSREIKLEKVAKADGEIVRFESKDLGLILTNYYSCGKKWLTGKPFMTVWFDSKK